jgi:magnesium-transporting ATPase (P-type)
MLVHWFVLTCVFFFIIFFFKHSVSVVDSILLGLSLAFAIIPEELPLLIKSVLAVGSLSLSRKNLLMKNLHAAELLGLFVCLFSFSLVFVFVFYLNRFHLFFISFKEKFLDACS